MTIRFTADADRGKYSGKIYDIGATADSKDDQVDVEDIDAEIAKELDSLRKPDSQPLFTSIRLDTQCRKRHSIYILDSNSPNMHDSRLLQGTPTDRARLFRASNMLRCSIQYIQKTEPLRETLDAHDAHGKSDGDWSWRGRTTGACATLP
jgi:hypothetical protein